MVGQFLEEIGYLDDDKSFGAKLAAGALMARMMESLQYNLHPLDQLRVENSQVDDIGAALYPVAAR